MSHPVPPGPTRSHHPHSVDHQPASRPPTGCLQVASCPAECPKSRPQCLKSGGEQRKSCSALQKLWCHRERAGDGRQRLQGCTTTRDAQRRSSFEPEFRLKKLVNPRVARFWTPPPDFHPVPRPAPITLPLPREGLSARSHARGGADQKWGIQTIPENHFPQAIYNTRPLPARPLGGAGSAVARKQGQSRGVVQGQGGRVVAILRINAIERGAFFGGFFNGIKNGGEHGFSDT